MPILLILLSVFISLACPSQAHSLPPALEQYHWKNRLVIVLAPIKHKNLLNEQQIEFNKHQQDILERDVVVIYGFDNTVHATQEPTQSIPIEELYDALHAPLDQYSVTLIGKDGRVKMRFDKFTKSEDIFNIIDAMPMRRLEMQRDN